MLSVGLALALTALAVVGAEWFARARHLPEFAARKVLHCAAACLVAAGGWWLGQSPYTVVGLVFGVAMAASRFAPPGLIATLGDLRRSSWGEVAFPLGVAGAAWLAPDRAGFVAAVMVLGAADTAAAVVGRVWSARARCRPTSPSPPLSAASPAGIPDDVGQSDPGSRRIGPGRVWRCLTGGKTAVGSLAFGVVASVILVFFRDLPVGIVLALVATTVEAVSPRGLDNLTVPLSLVLAWRIG
ncbi:MAG: hypothetical protein LBJ62_06800 [Bifidobacteriaceae bacterium]|jgi:dolichol kinase|nr:hypothetical protein [Bifidobacteriaceae bacterium]